MPSESLSVIERFLDHLQYQRRYSPHTVLAYRNDLFAFFDFLEHTYSLYTPADVTPSIVRSWLASLKEEGMTAKSINRKISSLKSFFKFQIRQGSVKSSPLTTLVTPKIKKRLPRFVDEKDTSALFAHVEFPDDWQGKTHRLILEIFYHTGIRQAELVHLRESQVDVGNRSLKVLGKGNKERILPLNEKLMAAIGDYMAAKSSFLETPEPSWLLLNDKGRKLYPRYVYNVVKKYLSLVTTIDKKSPHVLRHTFATHLMNNGAELNAVKELLGHSSLAATQVYTHNSIEKLKNIHKKAHPRS
jgi:integrase/recombinase XerC